MYIKEISLMQFRNYETLELQFHKKLNVITGPNAQGKTNLLEGIYVMSLGKSFRTSRDSEMISFGCDFCRAKTVSVRTTGRVGNDGEEETEETEIEITYKKEGKLIKIDGVKAMKTSELLEHVYAVVFSPEDLKIVKEEPEKRRKFIDRELCQIRPVYYKNLGRYKKVLQNRNFLLKDGMTDPQLMSVYDEELADYGARIMLDRARFIEKLSEISRDIHSRITDGKEVLEVSYESNVPLCESLSEQKAVFSAGLQKTLSRDSFKGSTELGPHKDDLSLKVNGIDIRRYGSQGQQRTAALSLKLAEIYLIKEETGEDAVLLLDDVLSELDVQRQTFLLNRLKDIQIFITTTEINPTLEENLKEGYVFQVENGHIVLSQTL